jgi:hypothetical protein
VHVLSCAVADEQSAVKWLVGSSSVNVPSHGVAAETRQQSTSNGGELLLRTSKYSTKYLL